MSFVHDPRPSFDEARRLIRAASPAPRPVLRSLCDSLGYRTAVPVAALSDHPRFDCSAMDGYVVPSALLPPGLAFPVDLPIAPGVRAGHESDPDIRPAVRPISTGAVLPARSHTVITRERATVDDGPGGAILRLLDMPMAGQNIRRKGEDFKADDVIMDAGQLITAEALGALAAAGISDVTVHDRPTLAMLRTGDEVTARGIRPAPYAIFDINGPMIGAMASRVGLPIAETIQIQDDLSATIAAIERLASARTDIILSSGGVSAGEHDHVPAALAHLGADVHFHGVRMRPGKPVLFATLPGGGLFFGLPGNPIAAATAFRFFVIDAVRAMMGLPAEPGISIDVGVEPHPSATLILKTRLNAAPGAAMAVTILPGQQSHRMRPLVDADTWLVVDPGPNGTGRARAFPMAPADLVLG